MYVLYRLTTTVTQNTRKTSSNCMVKEVQPWFACRRVKISHCDRLIEVKCSKINQLGILNGDRVCLIAACVAGGLIGARCKFTRCKFVSGEAARVWGGAKAGRESRLPFAPPENLDPPPLRSAPDSRGPFSRLRRLRICIARQ